MAAPSISRGAAAAALKFIPQSDLTVLDPIWTTAYVTAITATWCSTRCSARTARRGPRRRCGGLTIEDDGKQWDLMLRDGLIWHDGERCSRATASPASGAGPRAMAFGQADEGAPTS